MIPILGITELIHIKKEELYSQIEKLIINWNIDGTKTAGHPTIKFPLSN
jgi:hypothetical protein